MRRLVARITTSIKMCRNFSALSFLIKILSKNYCLIYTFSPLLCLIKYLMHNFFRCISAWQRSRDIVRTETVQTIQSIQVICYYSVRFYHFNFSPVLTCLNCEQIYKAGAGAGVFMPSPAGAGAEKPEIAQP